MMVMLMYLIQLKQIWNDPPDWRTLATFTDKEQAQAEVGRLTRNGCEVRLVNDADDVKGDENT